MSDPSNGLRDLYLRQRGWTPHFAEKGKWWRSDPCKAIPAEDAAKQQVDIDEACMVYMLGRLSPQASALLRSHVMMAWTHEIGEFAKDPEEQAKLKARAAEWLATPDGQGAVRELGKALRAIVEAT